MDLESLKQKWKKDTDMHPAIDYDEKRLQKALKLKKREVGHVWYLPVLTLLGLLAVLYLTWPQTGGSFSAARILTVVVLATYNIYFLYRYRQYSRNYSQEQPLENLRIKTHLMEQFCGFLTLLMAGMSIAQIIEWEGSWSALAEKAYVVWLYSLVFLGLWLRYRRSRTELDEWLREDFEKPGSWADSVEQENRKIIRRFYWLMPLSGAVLLGLGITWYFFYPTDTMMGFIAGTVFGMGILVFEYLRRKKLLDE